MRTASARCPQLDSIGAPRKSGGFGRRVGSLVPKTDGGGDRFRADLGGAISRGPAINLQVDGVAVRAYAGETVAAAMLAAGIRGFRRSPRGSPRSVYCGIGVCFECLVRVDGQPNLRACITYAADGMTVDRPDWSSAAERRPAGEQP